MKKVQNYFRTKKDEEEVQLDFNDYSEMFQDGYSDSEISLEFKVDENFVKKLRDEYQQDS